MIEGYTADGVRVLLNPHHVIEVFSGDQAWNPWCNVKMSNGTLHRFTGPESTKVFAALQAAALEATATA